MEREQVEREIEAEFKKSRNRVVNRNARVPLFGGGRLEWCATAWNKQCRGRPEREVRRPVRLAFRGNAKTAAWTPRVSQGLTTSTPWGILKE
jgi:hypothetical protein